MNQQTRQSMLSYTLLIVTSLCIIYILSAFGILDFYPHFFGKRHPHRWFTLFRLCFVIVFAVVNYRYFIPHLYLKRQYAAYFSIILLGLIAVWVLPDLILKQPTPPFGLTKHGGTPSKFNGEKPLPPFHKTLAIELAHMYLLFVMSTIAGMTVQTRQYVQKIEQQNAELLLNLKEVTERESVFEEEIATESALTVTVNYSLVRIEFSEILFIKGVGNYLQFHLKDKKPLLVRMTLKEASEKLPTETFMRVHKSYIVSLSAIDSIRNKTIYVDAQEIPIGNTYEESVLKVFGK